MAINIIYIFYCSTIIPLIFSDFISAEALHLAHLMSSHGYLFPIDDHILTVKNDNTYYRFQVSIYSSISMAIREFQWLSGNFNVYPEFFLTEWDWVWVAYGYSIKIPLNVLSYEQLCLIVLGQ